MLQPHFGIINMRM